jgi:hypothetical protein
MKTLPLTESYCVTITAAHETRNATMTFKTNVTITEDQPFTDVTDEAQEAFYAKHPNGWEVMDTSEELVK